jgi:hypothetical protein
VSWLSAARRNAREPGGQALVEFAVLVPAFMLILLSLLEFGLIFNNYLTLEYATREGARTGSAMANGGGPSNSATDSSLPLYAGDPATVDPYVIAAVERVLESSGSPITPSQISAVTITQYGTTNTNTWKYSKGAGPALDGKNLDFVQSGPTNWPDSARHNGTSPDSIVVSISYTYKWVTPLASVMRSFGGAGAGQTTVSDTTTMALNPFQ